MERFSYTRLEVISVLFKSWEDLETKLRIKSSRITDYSFCFVYVKKPVNCKKGSMTLYSFSMFKCGYFVYTPNSIWLYLNRSNREQRDKVYDKAILIKRGLLKKLKEVHESFNEKNSLYPFIKDTKKKYPYKSNEMLIYTIPAISINAAILEGTLREILARYLQNEIDNYTDEGNKTGRTKHNNYQKLLVAKQFKIESGSSYSNLITEYSIIFDLKISELISPDVSKIINSLFTLRNIFAHGTSVVTTNKPVTQDEYFKQWNIKVDELQKVLRKYFGSDDVYLNLSDNRIISFYMAYTRIFLMKIISLVREYDDSAATALESINFIRTLTNERGLNYYYDERYLEMF